MAATTTQGTGPGSAADHGAGNKGSEHMSLAVHRLIGPRIVMCGDIQLDGGGSGNVTFPTLPVKEGNAPTDDYCIFLSTTNPFGGTHALWHSFSENDFSITGDDNQPVCWTIVKKGHWGSIENNGPAENIANT